MHICHIVVDNVGGAPRVADMIASANVKDGHEVSVIILREADKTWNLFTCTSNVFVLNARSNLSATKRLAKLVNQLRPDILIGHGPYVIRAIYFSSLIPGNLSLPYIGYSHNDLVNEIFEPRKEGWLRDWLRSNYLGKFALNLTIKALNRADGLIFVCQSLYERHKQIGLVNNNVIVSYNPLLPSIQDTSLDAIAESWLNDTNLVTFVSAARLDKQKDHDTLLKAFALVCQNHPHARLVLLGDGKLENNLKTLALTLNVSKQVLFLGYVPNPSAYFALSRASILSSHYEGLGMVLVESVASGTTFIATDCPTGPREVSELLQCGTLVPLKDTVALADAIIEHIKTPKVFLDKSEQLQSFSLSTCIQNFNSVINKYQINN